MEFVYDLCLSKDSELVLSGQQDYVTKISTWFGAEDSTKHGLNIATYDADGNLVGGVIDLNGHKLSNAELTDTTIKLPSPNQVIVQTVTNVGLKVEYPVTFPQYKSTLATTDDLGYVKNPVNPDGNGNYYGYYGSLENLGINEAYVDVKSISYKRRTDSHSTDPSASDYIKARIMRLINGAWTIYSESKQWLKPESFPELGSDVGEFTMQKVQGAGPLSNKESIGIIFVIANAVAPGNRPLQLGMSVSASNSSAAGMGIATGPLWIEQGGVPKMESRLPLLTLKYNVDQVFDRLTEEEIAEMTTLQNVVDNSVDDNNQIHASLGTTAQGASLVIDSNKSNSSIIIGDSTSGSQTNASEFFSVISASNANDIRLNANEGLSLGVGLKGFVSNGTLPNTIQPNSFGIFASGTNGSASIMSGSTLAGSSVVAYTQFGGGNITSYAPNVMTIQGNSMLMASSDNLLLTGNQNIVMTSNGYNNNVNGSMSIDVGQNTTLTSNKFENVVSEFQIDSGNGTTLCSDGCYYTDNGFVINQSAFYLGSRRDPKRPLNSNIAPCLSLHVVGNAFIAGINDPYACASAVICSFNGGLWGSDTDLRLYGKNKVLIGRSEVLIPNLGADAIGSQYLSNYGGIMYDSEGNPDQTHYSRAVSADTLCQFMTSRMSGQGLAYNSTTKNYYVPTASSSVFGVVKVGGRGIMINNGVLALNYRSSHSGFDFSGNSVYVNVKDSEHPKAGTTYPIATDAGGQLVVGNKLNDDLNNVWPLGLGMRVSQTDSSLTFDNSNFYGWLGTLGSLGVGDGIVTKIMLYRRSEANQASTANTPLYARIVKKDANNNWIVASQSINAVAFSSQTNEGLPIPPWFMSPIPGVKQPTPDEQVAIVFVDSPDAAATASSIIGAKVSNSLSGALTNVLTSGTTGSYGPRIDLTWSPNYASKAESEEVEALKSKVQTLESSLSAAEQKITALESALGGLKLVQLTQSEYDALTTKDANTLYFIKEEPTATTTTEESEA